MIVNIAKSTCPMKNKEYQNQTQIVDIDDEEFESLSSPNQFTTKQKFFQILTFCLFFGPFRLVFIFCVFIFTSLILVSFQILSQLLQMNRKWGKSFSLAVSRFGIRSILFLLGAIYIQVDGYCEPNSRFIVANHICMLDQFIIILFKNLTLPIDHKYRLFPLLPYLLESINTVYVDFGSLKSYSKKVVDIADNVIGCDPVLVFPEGKPCGKGRALMKFSNTAFSTPYKVQPVTLRYNMMCVPQGYNTFSYQNENIFYYFFRLLSIGPCTITISFLNYISMDKDAKCDVSKFSEVAQLTMANYIGIKAVNKSSENSKDKIE